MICDYYDILFWVKFYVYLNELLSFLIRIFFGENVLLLVEELIVNKVFFEV